MLKTAVLAALAFACLASIAEAKPQPACIETGTVMRPSCMGNDFLAGVKSIKVRMHRDRRSEVIGGRPKGCPHAFCGCGASLYLFGRIIPSLNLAANWLRFPRTVPAPKMVAARRGHVFVLEQHIRGDIWLVHDSNSGHHQTRVHARSIAGFTVVNPLGVSS